MAAELLSAFLYAQQPIVTGRRLRRFDEAAAIIRYRDWRLRSTLA